jgi:hypothetical protein
MQLAGAESPGQAEDSEPANLAHLQDFAAPESIQIE